MTSLILASNSPRRKELLHGAGFNFETIVSNFEEVNAFKSSRYCALLNAEGKAKDVFNKLLSVKHEDFCIISADTVVDLNGKILGKPKSEEEAVEMLNALSNNTHMVITAFCIVSKTDFLLKAEESLVLFNNLSKEEIYSYVKTGKPFDKAGAYGVQDGFNLVKEVRGSFSNVVGLPIETVSFILTERFKVR